MIMLGDKEKTFQFLRQFSRLLTSAFLWLPRLHISVRLQSVFKGGFEILRTLYLHTLGHNFICEGLCNKLYSFFYLNVF